MAKTEVETILREIRERVLSEQRDVTTTRPATTNGGNGPGAPLQIANDDSQPLAVNLSLIESYLTTTARAWDRLPPLVSNRSGFIARVELWLKRRLRAGTRWFTWEQVNFNAAVHHALRDLLPVLSAHEQELQTLRAQLAESEGRRRALEIELERLTEQQSELRNMIETQRRATDLQRDQGDARFARLANELRERDERLQDEQRVCFKQLALETSEAAVLEDRARRKTESLLEGLSQRIKQLEKK